MAARQTRPSPQYALFDTAFGPIGIAWRGEGLVATHLPAATAQETEESLVRRVPEAVRAEPPLDVRQVIRAIEQHLTGEHQAFADVRLDFSSVTPFRRNVYEAARAIPAGTTRSYGELAALVGSPGASRAIGQAMATNPFPIIVPCHRVLAANGKLGGFSAPDGSNLKRRLLALEGVMLRSARKAQAELPLDGDEAVRFLSKVDPVLHKHMARVGPPLIERRPLDGTYEALAQAIIYQQLHGKAAATIAGRVKALFGRDTYPPPVMLLAASDEDLRSAGLSRNKLAALRDLAQKVIDGTVPSLAALQGLSDEEIIKRLTVVRGIGRWTVEMLLLFRMGRPDVLPVDDFGVRKGFGILYRNGAMPTPAEVAEHAERWRPFRSTASWYLWRAVDT